MQLNKLDLTKAQIEILKKKKIYTVEAFLRKPPLHCYDFSKIYSLDITNEDTKKAIDKGIPFAIHGKCISIENTFNEKTKLKLRFEDLNSINSFNKGNTLFVNYISFDQFRIAYYGRNPKSPHNLNIDIPTELLFIENNVYDTNSSCKKNIDFLNTLLKPDVKDYISLKTGGKDGWSSINLSEITEYVDEKAIEIVKTYFYTPTAIATCLKWYLRGLNLKFSIIKTLLDDESSLRSSLINKGFLIGGFIKFDEDRGSYSALNPPAIQELDIDEQISKTPYFLQYSSIRGLSDDKYRKAIDEGIAKMSSLDIVPEKLLRKFNLPTLKEAMYMSHYPKNYRDQCLSKDRNTFNDLLYLALRFNLLANEQTTLNGIKMKNYSLMQKYVSNLPFDLTGDQKKAVNRICSLMSKGMRANALVQGDVGTGKTAVAFCLALIAVAGGYQVALAAPYTTLAFQHYNDMKSAAEDLGVNVVLLSSDLKKKEKDKVLEDIKNGKAQIVIGTHSIFSKNIEYHNLSLILLDEEHKFGVVHRENFQEKALPGYHQITMSATPIPKSLAATIYDDTTEVISILEKPANRIPIQTAVCKQDKVAIDFLIKQIKEGHQGYIVCPAIEENEKSKKKVATIEEKEKIYRHALESLGYTLAVVTGKMKAEEKAEIMTRYTNGEIDVLMATTVIEVGINVPNATVIIITGAEMFGFSTLHQLRGRVGRGKYKSYCILQSEDIDENEKLQFMCTTTDGFEIAEKDLELRGPGSLFGDRQTGDNYYISLMLANQEMYKRIKEVAKDLCKDGTGEDIVKRYEELYVSEEER